MPVHETKALSLIAAYAFAEQHGLGDKAAQIRAMNGPSTVRRGFMVALLEDAHLFETFRDKHWSFATTAEGQRKLARYRTLYARFSSDASEDPPETSDESAAEDNPAFALEAHLRDFLADNLSRVEPGLRLYSTPTSSGIEFQVDGGRIDLLAIDSAGKFVVIELKLSRGRNKALGQLLYYLAWVDKHLGNGPCRGYIIANDISDELRLAVARAPSVQLAEYALSFAITPVSA